MTHLEKKMNRKQIDECKEKFIKYLKNHGDDKEDFETFQEQFAKWRNTEC